MTTDPASGTTLLDSLVRDEVLICPRCSATRLTPAANALACGGCGRRYPISNSTIDFLEYSTPATAVRDVSAPETVILGVIRTLELPDTPNTRSTVADIYSRTFRDVPSPYLSAEISSFADRFGVAADAPKGAH